MRALYVLLGDPVEHSRSPAIHARAFARLGVDAIYAPCRVAAGELATAVRGLSALAVRGFNATVPHKEALLSLVAASPEAARIGAVNCAVPGERGFTGYNTDARGVAACLQGLLQPGLRALVVGAGGSARAAAFVLADAGARVRIANRTAASATALAAAAGAVAVLREELDRELSTAELVVHCTTVGLDGASLPFDPAGMRRDAALLDLVYAGRGPTPLVEAARARGVRAIDGLDMLVHQAIASLHLWLGRNDLAGLFRELREAATP